MGRLGASGTPFLFVLDLLTRSVAAPDVAARTAAFPGSLACSNGPNSNSVAFSMARAQIGDAPTRADHFCVVIGQAAWRNLDCAGVWSRGKDSARGAGGQGASTSDGDTRLVAGLSPAADQRCGGALVSGTGERDRRRRRRISCSRWARGVGCVVHSALGA